MIVSDTAIKNRISVVIMAIIILVMGVYCYQEIPREDEPDITIPHVFVSTSYKGVAASDIETAITTQIEKKLKGLGAGPERRPSGKRPSPASSPRSAPRAQRSRRLPAPWKAHAELQ